MLYVDGAKRSVISNNRGSSLVLVLAFMAVAMSVVTVLNQPNINRSTIQNARVINGRNTLASHIRKYASMGGTFRASLNPEVVALNPALKSCILGDNTNPCIGMGLERPLTLYYPASTGAAGTSLKLISGPGPFGSADARAAFYDLKGGLCSNEVGTENAECPFEVYTTFSAACPAGDAVCPLASSIMVHFYIRYNAAVANTMVISMMQLAPVDEMTVSIDINDILPPDYGKATQNVVVTVINTNVQEVAATESTPFERAIETAGITDPVLIAKLKAAYEGIDNVKILNALISANITDQELAQDIASAILEAGVTSGRAMRVIAGAGITDPNQAIFVANSGITSSDFVRTIFDLGVDNPWIAGAMFESGITSVETLTQVWGAIANVDHSFALQYYLAYVGETSGERAAAFERAVIEGGVVDSYTIYIMVQEGITDGTQARLLEERLRAEYAAYLAESEARAIEEAAAAAGAAGETGDVAATDPAATTDPNADPNATVSTGGSTGSSGGEVIISQTEGETTIVVGSAETPVDVQPISTCVTDQCSSIVGY
ncbi:MAG: hypothetical protein AB7N80_09050 [Bdellovibrionales bacterium]